MRLVFDIEGNDLWERVTRIHCLVAKDIETGAVRRFRSHGKGDESMEAGLRYLEQADELIGHNILGYDIDALKKIYPSFSPKARLYDTIVVSALIFTNLMELDAQHRAIPTDCYGKHSLKAWGHRLKLLKGDFGSDGEDITAWAEWSQAMEDYCVQDVEVTHKLYRLLASKKYSERAIALEHEFKSIIVWQERHGFRFDVPGAEKLTAQLQGTRLQLTEELQKVFPARVEVLKTPAYYSFGTRQYPTIKAAVADGVKRSMLHAGPLREKLHPFNPGSRKQIADRLIERYQWKPKKFTEPSKNYPNGQVQIDESVLESLPYPEAKLLNKYLLVEKTLGQLAEGDNACLKLQRNGRIHGRVSTNGAVTGRCTHSTPNIAQTPAVMVAKGSDGKKAPVLGLAGGFGWEFRSLYVPDPEQVLVGWDASGLELRCLAHFLFPYDDGKFGELVTEGDPHTYNQGAADLFLRDSAKTFIYAFLYGAGDEKLGKIKRQDAIDAGKPLPKGTLKHLGSTTRAKFLANFAALGELKDTLKETLRKRQFLIGLDGRRLHIRSEHAALNTLLQSAGALLMKRALVFQHQFLSEKKRYAFLRDYAFVANVHDEVQTSCRPDIAKIVGESGPAALKKAGEFFGFRCRLDGEYKIGQSWAHTH